jgi:hypothetical protein
MLRRRWPLLAALAGLLVLAVTHRVTLSGAQVALFEPPSWALAVAGSLRASERFFWPLGYALLLGAVGAVAARWGGQRAGLLLLVLLAVQAADLRHGLATLRAHVADAPRQPVERLPHAFWEEAGRTYRRVRAVLAANQGEHWESVARFAARHGMPTDAVYLARIDAAAVTALRKTIAAALAAGRFEPGTLYVLRDPETLGIIAASLDPERDLLAEVDGLIVLAAGWFPERALLAGMRRIGRDQSASPQGAESPMPGPPPPVTPMTAGRPPHG